MTNTTICAHCGQGISEDADLTITEEWLFDAGFGRDCFSRAFIKQISQGHYLAVELPMRVLKAWRAEKPQFLCNAETRGQLRQLCAALGIELTESGTRVTEGET